MRVNIFSMHHIPANIAAIYTYGRMRSQTVFGGIILSVALSASGRTGSEADILAAKSSKNPSGTVIPSRRAAFINMSLFFFIEICLRGLDNVSFYHSV